MEAMSALRLAASRGAPALGSGNRAGARPAFGAGGRYVLVGRGRGGRRRGRLLGEAGLERLHEVDDLGPPRFGDGGDLLSLHPALDRPVVALSALVLAVL